MMGLRSAGELAPSVSIGMPVFNGERYIELALDSILAQTYDDFELLIVDNRSTDRTQEICRAYAARDPRVRTVRHRQNYGHVENFNAAFRLSSGRYFKWAAYDDILAPEFLARAVDVLDRDPSVVLVYPDMPTIDQDGCRIDIRYRGFDPEMLAMTSSADAAERFSATMHNFWYTDHLYGLIRSDALSRTRLHARHFIGDHILLSELSLYGRFHHVREPLLSLRRHTGQSSKAPSARDRLRVVGGASSTISAGLAIAWQYPRRFSLHVSAVGRAPLSRATRARCYVGMGRAILRWGRIRLETFTRPGTRSADGAASPAGPDAPWHTAPADAASRVEDPSPS